METTQENSTVPKIHECQKKVISFAEQLAAACWAKGDILTHLSSPEESNQLCRTIDASNVECGLVTIISCKRQQYER